MKYQFSIRRLLLFVAVIAIMTRIAVFLNHAMSPRIVASVVAPNGTELLVVQTFEGEPFTTSVYYRKAGGPWGWFYYEHEDWYWRHARAEIDLQNHCINVYRDGRVTVTFDYETETYQCVRPEFYDRPWHESRLEEVGAQQWHDPPIVPHGSAAPET